MKKTLLLIFLMVFTLGQSQTPVAGPTTPPTRNAWDVLSQYGSSYSNQPGVVFDSFGGSNIVGDVTLDDNSIVKKYTNHSYSGISGNGALSLNVPGMTHLHIDVWSPDFVSFKVKLEAVNGSNRELEVPFTKTQGSWNSYDLDLSTYSSGAGGVDLANLRWIVPVTFGPNNTTLFITNVYFYRPATIQPPTLGAFTVPAKFVGDAAFTLNPPTSNSAGAFSYTSSNPSVATILGNTVTIISGGTSTITAIQAADGSYGSGSTSAPLVVSYPAPSPSPVPPPRSPANVVSMFTGSPSVYANAITTVRAPWSNGATTLTEVSNGSNTCLQINNLGFLGLITNGANFSVAGMNKLHIDIYLNAPINSNPILSRLFIFLLAPGDNFHEEANLVAGWNSLDIDLSDYPGANLANIYGLKLEQNSSQTGPFQMYVDNVYFYVAGNAPSITDFTVPAKVFGDAPFTLTAPTSNSAGAFSYTSSNPSVATIIGNTVTLTGPGTSTITAIQAADGSFEAGSVTASLVVSAPPLATAAPTPPARNTWDVISLYSNAYTTQSSPVWQNAAATTDELLEGNDTKKMSNFLIELINFTPTDVSQMTTLHMDIYTPDCTGLNIWLLNNGDRNAQFFPSLNGWYSVDIPLSTYSNAGLNMNGIFNLKFESLNGPGKTVYVDNVYFYRPATVQPPTLGAFTVPAKAFGDPDFTLTPPTSNSAGAFSYTSSNPLVATISGDTVTIIGGGTSTITAIQAADGSYGTGSTTAQLVVSYPAPGPSPIPPAREPSRVVSMFTGSPSVYANAITAVRSNWTGATTLTEVPNGTNTCLRLDNFGFLGLVNQGDINFSAAGMTNLHIDVYLNAPLNSNPVLSRLFIFLLSNGDQFHEEANLVAGWNSLNIDLSQYPGANLADIYGLKFEQNTSSPTQIYIDNVYFSNDYYVYYADNDGDGYGDFSQPTLPISTGQPIGFVNNSLDCDDANPAINPNAVDVCYDGIDNDCNGIIDNACTPIVSTLNPAFCGVTLAGWYSTISANGVSFAQAYRFRITKVDSSDTPIGLSVDYDRPVNNISLANIAGVTYNSRYRIEVAIKYNNVWQPFFGAPCYVNTPTATTSIASCGSTLTSINQWITTTAVASVNSYRFRVTQLDASLNPVGTSQEITQSLNKFNMTQFSGYLYGTTYSVEVSLRNTDGVYLPYNTPCNITTPAHPTTQLQASFCNSVVANNTQLIYANAVSGATAYTFRVSYVVPGDPENQMNYDMTYTNNSFNRFTLNNFPGLLAGVTYSVEVSVKLASQPAFGPFGAVCSITTPGGIILVREGENKKLTSSNGVAFEAIAYPNPFANNFKLDVATASQATINVSVYDMLGKQVENKSINSSEIESFEVGNNYPSGIYNVVVSQGVETKTLRVIKK